MAEPKIVFCDNNHIYDAALHKRCPYCAKIAKEQNALSKSVKSGFASGIVGAFSAMEALKDEDSTELIRSTSASAEEDYTELIKKRTPVEEDYTELIRREKEDEVDYTELISRTSETVASQQPVERLSADAQNIDVEKKQAYNRGSLNDRDSVYEDISLKNEGHVLGWLVFKGGKQTGHSIEICEKTAYLYSDNEVCHATSEKLNSMEMIARIEIDGAIRIIPEEGHPLEINGRNGSAQLFLRSYDEVCIADFKMVFVELMVNLLRWR